MKVVILAAGRGSRMEEFTESTTKAMLMIEDPITYQKKPMLQIIMERCICCGLKDFIFVVGYRKEDIYRHFDDGSKWRASVSYVTQPNIKAGTADALRWAEKCFNTTTKGEFLLIYGDVIPSEKDLVNVISGASSGARGVMAVRTVKNPERYGVVETDGKNITRIVEKSKNPPTNLANAGIYVLPCPEIFEEISKTALSERGEFELTDSIQQVINRGITIRYQKIRNVKDIGTKMEYLQQIK